MPKVGFDDYMNTHTLEEFLALPNLSIDEAFDPEEIKQFERSTETANQIRDSYTHSKVVPFIGRQHRTDMGNAERLHLREAGNIKWSPDVGWRYWDGKRWKTDTTQEIMRRAKLTTRKIYIEASQEKDQDEREKLGKWAAQSESLPRLNAMIKLTESAEAVDSNIWDKNIWLLNLKNLTINLKTSERYEHKKEDYITKLIDIDYDPNAECPLWKNFLNRIVPHKEDQRFLQKAVGYSLTGATTEQCLFILYGLGANGKSTFINTIDAVISEYAEQTNSETLMVKQNQNQIPNDIARLAGARFVSAVETEGNKRLAESLVKRMTGGDKLSARFLNHEFFTFTPTFKIWIAVNHQPRIAGTDDGIWRRIHLVPFEVQIPETEQDENLPLKLLDELPGILAWAIDGASMWLIEKLGKSASVKSATERYREQSDVLNSFMEDCCTLSPNSLILKSELYEKYSAWTKQSGEYTLSKKTFGIRMLEKGFKDKKNPVWFWIGISLQ